MFNFHCYLNFKQIILLGWNFNITKKTRSNLFGFNDWLYKLIILWPLNQESACTRLYMRYILELGRNLYKCNV